MSRSNRSSGIRRKINGSWSRRKRSRSRRSSSLNRRSCSKTMKISIKNKISITKTRISSSMISSRRSSKRRNSSRSVSSRNHFPLAGDPLWAVVRCWHFGC